MRILIPSSDLDVDDFLDRDGPQDLQHDRDADWVAAKMLGRWRDGTPLIDRPTASAPGTPAQIFTNEFNPFSKPPTAVSKTGP